jgi:bla regulator protein blaR1
VMALHPAARWILRQIEREREMACDDWVVAHTGKAYSYAESLARVVELSAAREAPVLAAGIFTRRSRLRARIEALLQRGREFSPLTARRLVGTAAAALVLLAAAGAMAPHWIAFAQRLEFEVASVKHTTNNGPFGSAPRRSGDRFTMHNAQLYTVIYYAYHLRGNYQLVGDLGYGSDEWNSFDIDARVGHDATDDQVRLMAQSLLADRFDLKLHRETRELPEYLVTIAKGGPKLRPASEQPMEVRIEDRHFSQAKSTCSVTLWQEGAHLICHGATIEQILAEAVGELKAPVADRTGLTGIYDVNVLYLPDWRKMQPETETFATTGPSLSQAFQELLGLKLEKGKGPVEVIVVDHFEKKPREN